MTTQRMHIKDWLASINEPYSEYLAIRTTFYWDWTPAQTLLGAMVDEAMHEGLIRRWQWRQAIYRRERKEFLARDAQRYDHTDQEAADFVRDINAMSERAMNRGR